MLTLHLVRHGAAEAAEARAMGHTDPPLSAEGQSQVGRLAERSTLRPDRLISSDLRRAYETAMLLGRRWGLEPVRETRLREMNFGSWDGKPWSEIESADAAGLRSWMENWVAAPAPGGESFADVATRTREWLDEIQSAPPESIVVVAHAGSIRALLCHLLEAPLEAAFGFAVDRACVSTVEWTGDRGRLVRANSPAIFG